MLRRILCPFVTLILPLLISTGTYAQTPVSDLADLEAMTASGHYIIVADIDASGYNADIQDFSGILEASSKPDGTFYSINGLLRPLFTSINGGTVRNLILKNVNIGSYGGNTGAIASSATGASHIYNCGILSGLIGGTGYTGSLVGLLDGTSRVINCYSFGRITGGSVKGGIVGYNSYASKSGDIRTMVMNCMFYGDIVSGGDIYPIYGGLEISNEDSPKLNNYNYFLFEAPFSQDGLIAENHYNRALAAEERYLVRFEFYRYLLNSNRELASWYAYGSVQADARTKMAKWVLDKSIAPYPILKVQDYYPSAVNYDPDNTFDPETGTMVSRCSVTRRDQGRSLGELTVNISLGTGYPTGAAIRSGKSSISRKRTDKDTANFNFNYDKIQLPYYDEVGTGNCTGNKVVTGWKITGMTGGTQGTFSTSQDAPGYNFADRTTYAKDLYSQSGRVFSQGAYFEVPDGVTAINIEPYWGTAAYLSDAYYDSYGYETSKGVTDFGTRYVNDNLYAICGDQQKVYTSFGNALGTLSGSTVYDNAIVLVGNYHQKGTPSNGNKPFTIMSVDMDQDMEPDYSFIFNSGKGEQIAPIRFDFVNVPGTAMAHKKTSTTYMGIMGNHKWKGWLEVTNTSFIRFSQLEYDNEAKTASKAPVILMGGVVEQMVSTNGTEGSVEHTLYFHVGGNVWFKMFNNGCHIDKKNTRTHRIPISVTGGEYEKFYLSGYFQPSAPAYAENAECYISGGLFGELAGSGQELINGDVYWLIDHADITDFYGGGINDKKPITGDISVTISNSHVSNRYCGGPKFGNMSSGKSVSTTASNCTFGTFFGAGYGGTSLVRNNTYNKFDKTNYDWNGSIATTFSADNGSNKRGKYDANLGISINYEYEHFEGSNDKTVGRFYVNYATLSIAQVNNVTSTLTDCIINDNYYGGGSLGKVAGNAASTLTDCTVHGSVFGAGFSASVPPAIVYSKSVFTSQPTYNEKTGVFKKGVPPASEEFTWEHRDVVNNNATAFDDTGKHLYTTINFQDLGTVQGLVTLNIEGTTTIDHNVYGGGDESAVIGSTIVTIIDDVEIKGDVFGGGNEGQVDGETTVIIL